MSIDVSTGLDFLYKQKIDGVDTQLYPITRIENVYNSEGVSIDDIIDSLPVVPDLPSSNQTTQFLRGDGTWAVVPDGTTSAKGIVQLSDTVGTDSSKAATPTAVKSVSDALTTFTTTTAPATYVAIDDVNYGSYVSGKYNIATLGEDGTVPSSQLSISDATDSDSSSTLASSAAVKTVADAVSSLESGLSTSYVPLSSVNSANGVAGLNENGLIDSTYLPSYVDDVLEGYLQTRTIEGTPTSVFSETSAADGTLIPSETGKIYVDKATNKCYRYSGSTFIEISNPISIGTTSGTAYDGAAGATLRNDFDTHLDDENPHNITATTVGLGNVENKSGATIVSENVTASYVKTTLGAATTSADGYMTSAQATKLNNCQQIEVIYQDQEPSITDGLIIEILEDAPSEDD